MKRTFLCVAMSTVLTAGGAPTAFAAQTTLPGLMQPDTVILYDDAGEASILSGGYIASEEQTGGIPTEIVPGMKVVYDANGELNNIYYVDDFARRDTPYTEMQSIPAGMRRAHFCRNYLKYRKMQCFACLKTYFRG